MDVAFVNNPILPALNGTDNPGFLDFTLLSQDHIDTYLNASGTFLSEKAEVTGCQTYWSDASTAPVQVTRLFSKIGFGDIKLTGENGIVLLKNTSNFKIGIGDESKINSSESARWASCNKRVTDGFLDFNNPKMERLHLQNMNLSGEHRVTVNK